MFRRSLAVGVFCRGSSRKSVDNLAGASVVQLFAGLVFDGIGIALQPLDMTFQQLIFPLKAAQLTLQHLRILPLLLVSRKSVLSEDDVIAHSNSEHSRPCCCDLSPFCMNSFVQSHDGGTSSHCARCVRTAHTISSTNFDASPVKWKTLASRDAYQVHTEADAQFGVSTDMGIGFWSAFGLGYFAFRDARNPEQIFVHFGIRCTSVCTLVFLLRHMQILFAISIVCFIALVWAGIAIARHVVTGNKGGSASAAKESRGDFAHYLFAAKENGETRHPRAVRPQTMRDVAAKKGWNSAPASIEIHPVHEENASSSVQGQRKPPQTSHNDTPERLDWAYFNKDAGDLTDPYQTTRFRANSGTRATSSKRY